MDYTIEDIASIVKGKIIQYNSKVIHNICIDSRKCCTSSLFIPIPGENTDGTELAWDLGNGSTFTITDDFVDVYVYVYISTSTKDSTGYVWNPNLIRIE